MKNTHISKEQNNVSQIISSGQRHNMLKAYTENVKQCLPMIRVYTMIQIGRNLD